MSASAFLLGLMGTSMSALATKTRKIPRASPSALEEICPLPVRRQLGALLRWIIRYVMTCR